MLCKVRNAICESQHLSLKPFHVLELVGSANIAVGQRCRYGFVVCILTPLVKSERDRSQSRGVWCGMVAVALVCLRYDSLARARPG